MFKKFFVPLFASLLAISSFIGTKQKTSQAVALENSGDGFELTETSFNASESFVYTAVANFESGQACGLVIGGSQDQVYWVFNVDRYDNRTKLMRFGRTGPTSWDVRVLREEPFIGNDKTTQSEYNVINPKLRECNQFNFKVVLTIEDSHAYIECFLDNIKRFGVDSTIDLNTLINDVHYEGGFLGFNVFNGNVNFTDINIGHSDYAYYTEMYRNQYHYSQYAHWNNDPNGLVYYDGWYHMFYQTHPFSQYWSDMYWGHARSRDLIHWQELPIALFPDDGTMGQGLGVGLAWSGIAMVYHQGMSEEIDNRGWFPTGEGLLGYFTRDGEKQDQVIIVSNDGGMTWTKVWLVSQHLINDQKKIDCRDPSIFPVKKENDKVTLWGMVLSGAVENKYWFLKSEDLVNWQFAGEQNYIYPECLTVSKVKTSDNEEHYAMTVSSRYYTIGDFVYNETTGNIDFILPDHRNIRDVPQNEAFKKMDFGEDSYAAQTFFIDDSDSEYYGKSISISWYSGLPSDAESGIYAQVRKPWNGGGMTIPVELGLEKVGNEYFLTQKPITINNEHLQKQSLVNVTDVEFNNENNPLDDVNSHLIELEANISNPNEETVEFKINVSSDEYTSFGWSKSEGYFIDRTHTSRAGINFTKGYSRRFTTGPVDGTELSFYVLVDNGGFEVFCDNFKYAFYNLTLAAPYSIGASLQTSGEVTINSLKVQQISSIWHDIAELDKGVLYLDKDNLEMDLTIGQVQTIMAYSSNNSDISWEITEGNEVISLLKTNKGATVSALKEGNAKITVTSGDTIKVINVTVSDGEVNCTAFDLDECDVYSGSWLVTSEGLVGKQTSGDGFLISNQMGTNFIYSATFDVSEAAAVGLLLRASKDMSSYIMVNYDKNVGVCKMWSPNGLIAEANVSDIDASEVTLKANVAGRNIDLYLNNTKVLTGLAKESDPLSGYFGLNVFNGKVVVDDITRANPFKATFNANGGSGTMADVENVGDKYSLPKCSFTAPDGYHFAGWKVNGEGDTKAADTEIDVTDNIELFAQWEITTYSVYFNANGGEGTMEVVNDLVGEYSLPGCEFTAPAGKEFAGWKINNLGNLLAEGTKVNIVTNITLVAQWEFVSSTVNFVSGQDVEFENDNQYILNIYNITDRNTLVERDYYQIEDDKIVISEEYFKLLDENKTYSFFVEGEEHSFIVKVVIAEIERTLTIEDMEIKEGEPVNVYLGAFAFESLVIDDEVVEASNYELRGNVLHISESLFTVGTHTVSVNGVTFIVTVNDIKEEFPDEEEPDTPVTPDTPDTPDQPDTPVTPDTPTPSGDDDKTPGTKVDQDIDFGCHGSVIASSSLLAITSLLGFVFLNIRRKKDGE